jgi:hypothetical protein
MGNARTAVEHRSSSIKRVHRAGLCFTRIPMMQHSIPPHKLTRVHSKCQKTLADMHMLCDAIAHGIKGLACTVLTCACSFISTLMESKADLKRVISTGFHPTSTLRRIATQLFLPRSHCLGLQRKTSFFVRTTIIHNTRIHRILLITPPRVYPL